MEKDWNEIDEEVWKSDLKESKELIEDMKNTKMLSECCDAEIKSDTGDEGTGCWMCSECNEPCNPA